MIVKKTKLNGSPDLRGFSPEDTLFFDIETTGLSPFQAEIYLIGAVTAEPDGTFYATQFFSESFSDEASLLKAFFELGSSRHAWISFNGESFDLRFLREAAKQYGIDDAPLSARQIDLMRSARVASKLFPDALPSCRQKAVESFLSIHRDDMFSGGELVRVYHDYRHEPDDSLLRLLLLHNFDDIVGMTKILPIRSYQAFFEQLDAKGEVSCEDSGNELIITSAAEIGFPVPYAKTLTTGARLSLSGTQCTLNVPVIHETLRRYYRDYRNYYYLLDEGYAIHRSVGEFVDRKHRVPAKRETAFTLYESRFIPAAQKTPELSYRNAYDDPVSYLDLRDVDPLSYLIDSLSELR